MGRRGVAPRRHLPRGRPARARGRPVGRARGLGAGARRRPVGRAPGHHRPPYARRRMCPRAMRPRTSPSVRATPSRRRRWAGRRSPGLGPLH